MTKDLVVDEYPELIIAGMHEPDGKKIEHEFAVPRLLLDFKILHIRLMQGLDFGQIEKLERKIEFTLYLPAPSIHPSTTASWSWTPTLNAW